MSFFKPSRKYKKSKKSKRRHNKTKRRIKMYGGWGGFIMPPGIYINNKKLQKGGWGEINYTTNM